MPSPRDETDSDIPPWPQRLYDSIWLIAGTAIVFWVLSYVIWGVIDLLTLPGGG
jgi:hypothetical protein